MTCPAQDDSLNDEQQLYARFEALLGKHDFNFKRGRPHERRNACLRTVLDAARCMFLLHAAAACCCRARSVFWHHLLIPGSTGVRHRTICAGDKVTGTVFSIDQRGAYVDIGAKGAAFVPSDELSLSKIERVRSVRASSV